MPRKYLQGYAPSKPFCVYLITCLPNGKRYVGKASDAWKRWCAHRRHAWTKTPECAALYRAMRKHGLPAFRVELLSEHSTESEAYEAEREAIARLGTQTPNGYNLTGGGTGGVGHTKSVAWRAEHASRMRALHADPEFIAKHRAGQANARREAKWSEGLCSDWPRARAFRGDDGLYACRQPRRGWGRCSADPGAASPSRAA